METSEFKREKLRQNRLERLGGSPDPKCLFCAENDPACLEVHHLAGGKYGTETIIVCRNHHRKIGDKQREHPSALPGKPSPNECHGRLLLGLADASELLGHPVELFEPTRKLGLELIKAAQERHPPETGHD